MRALITGASGGLGPAVVQRFLDAGWDVAAVARSWPGDPSPVRRIAADLTKPMESRRAVSEADHPTAVVHVMGGFAGGSPVAETDDATWDRMMSINLDSAFYIFRSALPGMLAAGRGRLIAIGSAVAAKPAANLSAYGVSKAALVHLIRTIALEVTGTGVTANIILPGTIDTAANRKAMPAANFGEWVKPGAIANLAVWLSSDEAAQVNGAVIPVYGGV